MRTVCVVLLAISLVACGADEQQIRRFLEHEGYREIVLTGSEFVGCHRDEFQATGFTALNATGTRVSGVVCGGFGANTVRLQ
jgi:hypothetical protein